MIQGDKSPCSLDYHPLKPMANPRSRFLGFESSYLNSEVQIGYTSLRMLRKAVNRLNDL